MGLEGHRRIVLDVLVGAALAAITVGARDRAQLVVIAYQTGLVRPGDTA